MDVFTIKILLRGIYLSVEVPGNSPIGVGRLHNMASHVGEAGFPQRGDLILVSQQQ